MDQPALPVISLEDAPNDVATAIGESFHRHGFALVKDHSMDVDLIERAWALVKAFFTLPETEKRRYLMDGLAGARGYTPFGTEIAKDANLHDLKEFWHIGRELPPEHPLLSDSMPLNIWPERPAGFEEVFIRLYNQFDELGTRVLSHVAVYLGLPHDWFKPAIANGNSVLRLLHYPPVKDDSNGALRAGPHEDINLITLLLGAEEAGLELLTKDGQWLGISPPEDAIVVNIGDMLQRLTNHHLPSTTHRVRNPEQTRAAASRYSMPFFLHLRSDFRFKTLPQFVTPEKPDRYPDSITADDYLQQRLMEIGLKA